MKIWNSTASPAELVQELNEFCRDTIHDALGIRFSAVGDDYLEGTMPVDSRTRQPYGLLHGGASLVLAESLGSVASAMIAKQENRLCVGVEINANHLHSVKAGSGLVTGRAKLLHTGSTLHVWEIKITDEQSRLVCVSRLTVLLKDKR